MRMGQGLGQKTLQEGVDSVKKRAGGHSGNGVLPGLGLVYFAKNRNKAKHSLWRMPRLPGWVGHLASSKQAARCAVSKRATKDFPIALTNVWC